MSFADLGLSAELVQAVTDAGYVEPTPIQAQAIPVVLMGRDVLGCAQTGTGKTASFTLPMIEILAGGQTKARAPRSLILEPTRELAAQVAENFTKYGKYSKLSMALLIGGVSFGDQEDALDRGVDVLIATPGRLLDHFERGKVLMNFVKTLVIDEADRMLDMGFMPDVEKIVSMLSPMRQTLFFSATMADEMRRLANKFLQNPKEITVSAPATTATNVSQHIVVVEEDDKREALRRLLRAEDVKNAIIFCNRKRDVDVVAKSLVKHGFNARAIHGDLPQSYRTETLEKFKSGEVTVLIASDVAARGIDVVDLSHVFNFDIPFAADDYVHRIGRTGRAGRSGRAYTLVSPTDTKLVEAVESLIKQTIPRYTVVGFDPLELIPADELTGTRRGGARGRGRNPRDAAKPGRGGRGEARARTPDAAPAEAPEAVAAAPVEARPERAPRPERPARPERAERPDRSPRPPRPEQGDRPERTAAPERAAQPFEARGDRFEERPRRDRDRPERDRSRRDYRDNDLGPSVLGFGKDVPAFMLIRAPLPTDLDEMKLMAEEAKAEAAQPARSRTAAPAPEAEASVTEAAAPVEAAEAPAPEEAAPAKPKRSRSGKKPAAKKAEAAPAEAAPAEVAPAVSADEAAKPAKKPRNRRSAKPAAEAEAMTGDATATDAPAAEASPAKRRRPSRRKAAATDGDAAPANDAAGEAPVSEG